MALAAACISVAAGASPAAQPTGEWNFRALLDGKPIGEHRFTVSGQGDERKVVSEADFAVRFLGVTAYRYRHKATEVWRGECLTSLSSTTDDDGKPESVRADQNDALLKGCVMSFAYWNPAIQTQTRLLNAQTGKLEAVQVRRIGSGSVEVRGKPVEATEFRITGPANPIVVWYSAQGEWIGLDSTVAGGRKLSYRLQ
ncbi:MAG: hypothetical protein H7Y61_10695 [Rhizobiales bacterium]|nr:hypothetical protein [Rhizobacter sp.]